MFKQKARGSTNSGKAAPMLIPVFLMNQQRQDKERDNVGTRKTPERSGIPHSGFVSSSLTINIFTTGILIVGESTRTLLTCCHTDVVHLVLLFNMNPF